MTLVVSELNEYGIVMVADSAVTRRPAGGGPAIVENTYTKLQGIPQAHAAISMWGNGRVGSQRTDEWIADFITRHSSITSITLLAKQLVDDLKNESIPAELGFHVAGYEMSGGVAQPMLFHVRNTDIEADGTYTLKEWTEGQEFPRPPDRVSLGRVWLWNGIFQSFSIIIQILEGYIPSIGSVLKTTLPPTDLERRGDYVQAFVRFVIGLHQSAGLLPSIGEPLRTALISPDGKVRVIE
jgi:hypothetical protein